jgi:hypothetical protein
MNHFVVTELTPIPPHAQLPSSLTHFLVPPRFVLPLPSVGPVLRHYDVK